MFRNNRNMLCILAGCNLLVLLIVLVWGLTRPSVNYTYSSSDLSVHQTSLDGEESSASGNYLDNSMEGTGKYIATPPVSLTKGIYLVTVSYQTNNSETDYCKTWAEYQLPRPRLRPYSPLQKPVHGSVSPLPQPEL